MMRRIVLGAATTMLSSAWGCASSATFMAEEPTEIMPSGVAPKPVADLETGPDDRPKLLLGYARWRDPDKSVSEVLAFVGEKDGWRKRMAEELGEKADMIDLLALNASFDFAFSLDPRSNLDDPDVLVAVSIPVSDFDAALAAANKEGPVEETRPGVYRLGGAEESCDLWKTSGDAPGRVICGPGKRDIATLGPWLARGLPQVPADPAALSLRLELEPFKAHFLPELRTLVDQGKVASAEMMRDELGTTDPLLIAAPGAALEEVFAFTEDFDALRLFADLDGAGRSASFGGTLTFSSNKSWFTKVLTETGGASGPPSIFWQAPHDADSVQFGQSSAPEHYEGIRAIAHRLVKLGLSQTPLSPSDQSAITTFIDDVPASRGAWAYAQGTLPGGVAKNKPRKVTPASAVKTMGEFVRGYVGWTVVGVDDPSGPYVKWLGEGHDVYGRLQAFARPLLSSLDPKALQLMPKVRFSRAPADFPRGSASLDVEVQFDSELAWDFANMDDDSNAAHPPGPKARGRFTITAVVVPDGPDRTWIGVSADRKILRQKIDSVLRGAPAARTIADRTDLEPLRRSGASFGGYFTWGNSLRNTLSLLPEAATGDAAKILDEAFAAMPNGGTTPILLVGQAKPGAEYGLAVHIQKGTFDDIVAAFGVVDLDKLGDLLDEPSAEESPDFQF